MDPLEYFLPMVIPCLSRQHLPLDALIITINITITIIIIINLFLNYSTRKTNPAT